MQNIEILNKVKIGKGFFPSAYGYKYQSNITIYKINGKLYAKSKKFAKNCFDGDLITLGFVCVNRLDFGDSIYKYAQCHLNKHKLI